MSKNYDLRRLSKTMARALRHAPQDYGLTLAEDGSVPLEDLLTGLRQRTAWRDVSAADVEAVLARPGKKRFALEEGRIRAMYGHSVARRIERQPSPPPRYLYHGTAPATVAAIMDEGLRPMRRQYVHLSPDVETAELVGRRKANRPVILRVRATDAHAQDVRFYATCDRVWLADHVPPAFIEETP